MPLSQAALEALIEASPDIVVATDARGMVAFYSDGARENLGHARDEIIGQFVARLYPSVDEARRVMNAMRDPAQGGRNRVINFPTTLLSKSGERCPVAISGVILTDPRGQEEGTIGFCRDMREIIRKDQLAVLGEIAIGLSHEINNPLEVIANQLELLDRFFSERASPAELAAERARLEAIRREVARIEANVGRLSEMAESQSYRSREYLGDARMVDLSARDDEAEALAGRRVLVVDDDPGVRDSVAEILRAAGALVFTAENGKRALAALETERFDLVLSDVVMPEMDGYELFQEVRRRSPSTAMVLMTAFYYDRDHVIKRSRLEGVQGVLFKKPIDPARLRATLAKLVSSRGPSSR